MRNDLQHTQLALPLEESSFLIEPFSLEPNSTINPLEASEIDPERIKNWPMVYILNQKKSGRPRLAYVGQTTKAQNRMRNHMSNPEKHVFDQVNLIFSPSFNQSVISDYERRLIQLLSAQGNYRLLNKNEGLIDSNYFQKEEYDGLFRELWNQLLEKDIVQSTIEEIESSSLFKYSPYKSLSPEQELAFEEILNQIKRIDDHPHPIVVQGMPGTGKTILAVFLLKALKDSKEFQGRNIRLLEPLSSLRNTLQKVAKSIDGLDAKDIIGPAELIKEEYGHKPQEKGFDIVLVDEAHRLRKYKNISDRGQFKKISKALGFDDLNTVTQFDWVLSQVKMPIFFYDPLQIVKPSSPDETYFRSLLPEYASRPIQLQTQMRIKEGDRYLKQIRSVLNGNIPEPLAIENYDFKIYDSFADFKKTFDRYKKKDNLTRMIAGFAWPWASKGWKSSSHEPRPIDIQIEGTNLYWNRTQDGWVDKGFANPEIAAEVGCIHTIQGYDLSQAFVIIGNDIQYDEENDRLIANREGYFDTNGKLQTTDEELTRYIRNIYYVLLTRGIFGTHIYAVDPKVREYLKRFFRLPEVS